MGSRQSDTGDERAVARALTHLAPLTAPNEREKDRIRQRVAGALAGIDTPTVRPVAGRAGRAPRGRRRARTKADPSPRGLSGARGRFAVAAVAVLALLGALGGMSLLMAKDALPGDALYGIKRTAEAASLGLTFDDEAEAVKHLEFAGARVDEITLLADRYPDSREAPVGGYLTALTDFDNDAKAGSRKLITLGTMGGGDQLRELRGWADTQRERLDAVDSRLPAAARTRKAGTDQLLARISARAGTLSGRMSCYQITSGERDDVGALPATGSCERAPGEPRVPAREQPEKPAEPPPAPPAPGDQQEPGGQLPTPPTPSPAEPPRMAALPPADTRPQPPQQPPAPPAPPGPQPIVVPVPTPPVAVPPLLPGLPAINLGG